MIKESKDFPKKQVYMTKHMRADITIEIEGQGYPWTVGILD